jgi:hypothetical protein
MGGSRRVPLPAVAITDGAYKRATYVYCVVRRGQKPVIAKDVEALPAAGAPRVLRIDEDLWLIVANVPLQAYDEKALREQLQDVEWMSRCGAAHQAVMDAMLECDAVVPMTLFTIFASDARALAEVKKGAARLDASLDRVAGRTEWIVRVMRGDASSATAPAGTSAEARGAPATRAGDAAESADVEAAPGSSRDPRAKSGREFLQAKVDQRQAVRRAAEETTTGVRGMMDALSGVADDVRDRTEARATGAASAVASAALLDVAYLVARTEEAEFERTARHAARPLTERGLRVSVTGPWPCYSFVSPEQPK